MQEYPFSSQFDARMDRKLHQQRAGVARDEAVMHPQIRSSPHQEVTFFQISDQRSYHTVSAI